mmetsp:Transcript_10133/g.10087  ORF Transcript_10133/g.10087 Transcript_10133/m.10087 type:complete len:241 (+) Transcript_10133:122-844(+)
MGRTSSIQEQLSLFSNKCQPIVKAICKDVKEDDDEVFSQLTFFLQSVIYETDYLIEINKELISDSEEEKKIEPVQSRDGHYKSTEIKMYHLSEQKEILVNTDGLYTSIALIINFFLSFPKKILLQGNVLFIFKRLFHSFPQFRRNLEDPIIMVLINIVHKYNELVTNRLRKSQVGSNDYEEQLVEDTYAEAQKFVNYLLAMDETEHTFKEKLFSRKELQQYLSAKNLEQYKPNPRCLSVT